MDRREKLAYDFLDRAFDYAKDATCNQRDPVQRAAEILALHRSRRPSPHGDPGRSSGAFPLSSGAVSAAQPPPAIPSSIANHFATWWAKFSLLAYVNIIVELLSSGLEAVGRTLAPNETLMVLRSQCRQVPSLDPRDKVSTLLIRNRLTELAMANTRRSNTRQQSPRLDSSEP